MYTVQKLAKLAGVTPRTLHYYDEIGLLKPSRVGENGYRYYGEDALLLLQQILLYRELELPLEKIRRIMHAPGFEISSALRGHRQNLQNRISRMEKIVSTVDSTILFLEGKKEMRNKQLFEPFSEEQQAEYAREAEQKYDPAIVHESNRKWKSYSNAEKQRVGEEGNAVYEGFVQAIDKGPTSPEAQACVEAWRAHMAYFWEPNDEQCLGLTDLYNDDPRFKANFDKIDPRLAEFVREAVKVYVMKKKK